MASIREVAKIAGVSPATVSRVMNGTANVDEEKKQRVLEAIQETGFKPNETGDGHCLRNHQRLLE
mgnify:CR=1 FL=1